LTGSGGIQEEAASLGKPILVMRKSNQRPEEVHLGTVDMAGTSEDLIVGKNIAAFRRPLAYQRIAEEVNPCKATERILQALSRYFYEEVVSDAFISSATEKVN